MALYYGDNHQVLRDRIATESVDLIYLDPPFNSKATYNVGNQGASGHDRMRGRTAEVSIPRTLFAENLRLIDGLESASCYYHRQPGTAIRGIPANMDVVQFNASALAFFGSGPVFGYAIWRLTRDGDANFSIRFKRWLARLLLNFARPSIPEGNPGEIATTFATIFDKIFSDRHLSWRCISRSCIASLSASLLFCVLYFSRLIIEVHDAEFSAVFFTAVVISVFVYNVIPDYLSLLETRLVIRVMSRSDSLSKMLGWTFVDLLLTALIAFIMLFPIIYAAAVFPTSPWFEVPAEVNLESRQDYSWNCSGKTDWVHRNMLTSVGTGFLCSFLMPATSSIGIVGIFVYTTFFTSIWLWLYALARIFIRVLTISRIGVRFAIWALPVRTHPIKAIAMTASVLACFGIWSVELISLL